MRARNTFGKFSVLAMLLIAFVASASTVAAAAPATIPASHTISVMVRNNMQPAPATIANAVTSRILRPVFGNNGVTVGGVSVSYFSGDIFVGTCLYGTIKVQGQGFIATEPTGSQFMVSGYGNGWTLKQLDAYNPAVAANYFEFSNPTLGADIFLTSVSTNGVDINIQQGDC